MSQSEVYKVLKKSRRWMTCREIAKKLKLDPISNTISGNLRRMWLSKELDREIRKEPYLRYYYKIKHRKKKK